MVHIIFSTAWYVFGLIVFLHNKSRGKPVDDWFYLAMICGNVWAASA